MDRMEVKKIELFQNMVGITDDEKYEKLAILYILGENQGFDILNNKLMVVRNACSFEQFKNKIKEMLRNE